MSKTKNYQLTLWDYGEEDFTLGRVREDLGENFTKLDTALKAEETARSTGLAKKAEVVTGVYTGDGAKNRAISLGFAPKAVLILPSDGQITATYCYLGGLALPGQPVIAKSNEMFALTSTGFRVSHTYISHTNYGEYVTVNKSGEVYHYLAVK